MANAIDETVARELTLLQLELKKRQWLAAQRWSQRMKTCLSSLGIGFTEWLVLDATWSLVDQTRDAVSQNEVGRVLELDTLAIWHVMAVLEHQGLVSRGCSMSGKAWRVFVTRKGGDLLRALAPSVSAVADERSGELDHRRHAGE